MSNEQRHKIIKIFAHRYYEVCKTNRVYHDNDYNWKRAEELLKIELEINGEQYVLQMLKENEKQNKEIS
jgi:hypothetical protein